VNDVSPFGAAEAGLPRWPIDGPDALADAVGCRASAACL
jgi:hypothetical protein